MFKSCTIKLTFVVYIGLFLPNILFAQMGVVGYAYGKGYIGNLEFPEYTTTTFPSNVQLDRLTHVIASDIGCEDDGSLFTGKLPNYWEGPPPPLNIWNGNKNEWLESLINRAHAKGVKVSICVSGDTTHFPQATNPTNLTTFVGNIVNFVNVHGFDGVNINWEYPTNEDEWNQCIALLQSLKNNLPSGKRLTIALSHATHVYDSVQDVPEQILSISDGIYLMTYDEGDSAWPSHSDVEKSIEAINNWVNLVTPTCEERKKLFLGSAFYGWHPVVNGQRVSYRDYILNNNPHWNSNPGDLPDDARSKAIHTRDNGFGGVFIWELGFDVGANHRQSLLKAIYDVMPHVSGPTLVCNTNTTFNLQNLPAGTSVTWTRSSNLTYVSGQGTTQYRVRAANSITNGPGWLKATINGPCGKVELPKHVIWVGTPTPSRPVVYYNPGMNSVCSRASHAVSTTQLSGITDYQWRLIYPDGFTWPLSSGSHTTVFCIDQVGTPFQVGVKVRMNGCSWSQEATRSFPVEECGFTSFCDDGGLVPTLMVSPNPASHQITISEIKESTNKAPWMLRIMPPHGVMKANMTATLPVNISLSGYKPGVYILHAFQDFG